MHVLESIIGATVYGPVCQGIEDKEEKVGAGDVAQW
jgi:hypothetical protein